MTANINILLIDTRVSHYEAIIAAVDPALSLGITFDYYTDTFDTLKERMRSSGVLANSVGLVQHNYKMPIFKIVDAQTTSSIIQQVETQDNELSTWAPLKEFIEWCKTELSTAHFDMMACALYSNPDWKYVIDALAVQTGVEIRASTDNTGSSSLGGNWFLESHVGINLKEVYFNDSINGYMGLLDSEMFNVDSLYLYTTQVPTITTLPPRPTRPTNPTLPLPAPTLPSRPTLPTGALPYTIPGVGPGNGGYAVSYGDDDDTNSFSKVSSQLKSNVIYLFSTPMALKSDGSLVLWGQYGSGKTISPVTANLSSGVVSVCTNNGNVYALKSDGSVVAYGVFTNFPAFPSSDLSSGVNFIAASYQDIACLKSDGSIRGWGSEVFKNSSSVPALIYPAGSNLNSGFVKLVTIDSPAAFAAIKTDGSVVFFGGTSASTNYLSNPTTFYPAGSNITSGVVDVFLTIGYDWNSCYIALKSDGSLVAWGAGASSLSTYITGKTAVKIIKMSSRPLILLSDGTYIDTLSGASAGTQTNIVDAIESNGRCIFLRSDGTLAWRGGNSFLYFFSTEISVHTNVVKMWNLYEGQFNQGAVILNSSGELRLLMNNVLLLSNVNNATVSNSIICAITSDGKVTTIKNRGAGGTSWNTWITSGPTLNFDKIYANNASLESATSVLAVTNSTNVSVVLKTQLVVPYFFSFNGTNAYATCPYNSYNTALDLVTGYTGTSSSIGGNAFTIETWYYQPAQTLNSTIVDRGNSCYLFQVSPNANTITANLGCLGFANTAISGTWLYATSAIVTTGKWCHLAITRSGTSYQFYINGVLKQTMTGPETLNRDDGVLGIGTQLAGTTTGSNFTNSGCSMYDLRLWNVCRTTIQIQSYMNVLVQPSSAGLVANYLLNDNSGTFYDRTRNALHCTIANYSSSLWVTTFGFLNIGVYLNPDFSFIRGIYLPSVSSASYVNLKYTDFTGANLTGINFSNVDLTGANFSGANLTNVNFTNAILKGITINNSTKFTGANFGGATAYSIIGSINPSFLSNSNFSYYFSNVGLSNALIDYNNANTSIALPPTSITNYVVYFASYNNFKKSNARFYISWATDSNALSFSSSSYTPKVRFQVVHQTTNVVGIDVLFDYAAGKGCIESTVPFYIDSENEGNGNVSDNGASANKNVPIRYRLWGELLNGTRSSSYVNVNQSSTAVTFFALSDDIITNAPSWYTSITTNSNSSNYSNSIGYMSNSNNALFLYGKQTFANGVISAGATFYNWATSTPYIIPATSGAWRSYAIDPTGNSVFIQNWNSTNTAWCRYVFSTNTLTVLNPGDSASNTVFNSTGTRAYANDIVNLLVYNFTTSTASVVSLGGHVNISNLRNMFIDKNDKYIVTSSYSIAQVYIINIVNDAFTKISTGQIVPNDTVMAALFDDSSTYCYAIFTGRTKIYRIKLSDATWSLFITLPIAASNNITIINKYLYIFGINSISQYSMIDTTAATPTVTVNSFPTGYDTVLQVYETKNNNVYCVVNYNGVPTIMHFTGFPNTFNNSSGIMMGPASMNYSNANLSNYNLSNKGFMNNSNFSNTTITNANFSNSNLENSSFGGTVVDYSTANFTGANINNLSFGDSLFNYTLDANLNATVTSYKGGASLVFPEKVSGTYTITAIAEFMSWGLPTGFTNFSFSATSKLVTIGRDAFIFLKLGTITSPFGPNTFFPPTLTTISYRSFYYSTVTNHPRATIILPQSVVTVGYTAFAQFGAQVQLKPTLEWSSVLTTPLATGSTFTYTATIRGPIGYTGYNDGYNPLSNRPIYYGSSNTSIATINSSTGLVTLVGIGTVTFTSSRDADAGEMTYTAADTITSATLTVTKGTPTLSAFSIASKNLGDSSFAVTAPASQNTIGAFHYTSNNSSVATITDAGTISIVNVGSATITANQDETTYFYAPTAITAVFTVGKGTPTLSFPSQSITKTIGDANFTVVATAPALSTGAFHYTFSNLIFGGISGTSFNRIAMSSNGQYISAIYSDPANYIYVSNNYGFTWTRYAFADPGNRIAMSSTGQYQAYNHAGGVFVSSNYGVSFAKTGTNNNGNIRVEMSDSGQYIISVGNSAQIYTSTDSGSTWAPKMTNAYWQDCAITANGSIQFALEWGSGQIFKTTDNWATNSTIYSSGISYQLNAMAISSDGKYLACNRAISSDYGVTWAATTIPSSTNIWTMVSISASGKIQALGNSEGIYFSIDYGATWNKDTYSATNASSLTTMRISRDGSFIAAGFGTNLIRMYIGGLAAANIATLNELSGSVSLTGGGSIIISASQDMSTSYNASTTSAKTLLIVNKVTPTLSNVTISKTYGDAAFQVTAPAGSSTSTGTMRYAFLSGDTTVASITGTGLITVNKVGTVVFSASQDETSGYNAPTPVTVTLTVSKATPTLIDFTIAPKYIGDSVFTLTAPTIKQYLYSINYPTQNTQLTNFPRISTLSHWEISISFNKTAVLNRYEFLMGNPISTTSGWAFFLNPGGGLHFVSYTEGIYWDFLSGILINTNYVLTIQRTSTHLYVFLKNVSTEVTVSSNRNYISDGYNLILTPDNICTFGTNNPPTTLSGIVSSVTVRDPRTTEVSNGPLRYAVKYTYANVFSSIAAGSQMMDSAMSLNGMYQTVTTYKNGFWLSANYGATWINKSPSSTAVGSVIYKAVTMSSSGQYQSVCVYGGYIYVSNDYGATWTKPATITAAKNFMAIKMSESGLHQTCVADGDYIYTSSDSGATWTQKTSIGLKSYYDVAMSADGSIQYAVVLNGGGILKSTDKWATSTFVTTGLTQYKVGSIEVSSTGTYITIVSFTDTGINDPVILSKDGGSTWTSFDPDGSTRTGWTSSNVGMSADGRVQMLCYSTAAYTGGLYLSVDSGVTWTNDVSINNNPCGISVSRDGTYMLSVSGSSDLLIYNIFSDMATIPASKKVATIDELTGQVTIVGAGLVTVTASQDLTTNYNAPTPISAKFLVNKVTPVLSNVTISKTYGTTVGPITIPTLAVTGFPVMNSLTNWILDIGFTATGGANSWRALLGSMYNAVDSRGWGIWINNSNTIYYSHKNMTYDFTNGSVSINVAYNLNITRVGTSITFKLTNVSTQVSSTYTATNVTDPMGLGPVSIGGWVSGSETFPGTINYVVVKDYISIGDKVFQLTAPAGSSTSGGTMRYAFLSGDTTVASVTELGSTTVNKVGTVVFSASQDETSSYYAPTPVTTTLTVSKATPTLSNFTIAPKTTADSVFTLTAPTGSSVSGGTMRYAVKYTYANMFSSIAAGSQMMDSAMSLNGMYQTVTTYKNGFWLSANYGATWINKSPSSTAVGSVIYKAVTMSSSGQYQSVCVYGGYIYVSNDYGATWTKPATITAAKNFMAIKMSESGLHQTCVADGDYIYTSSDSGATWTQKTSIGLKSYYDVAMSADGSIQYAVVLNGGGILKSTDKWATSTFVTTGLTQYKVGSIEVSSTGTYITIVSFTDTGINDPVILSKDGGSTWTSFDPDGSTRTGWTSSNVGMSADGRVQMLCYNTAAYTGGLYFSIDYGTTWTNDVSINNSPCGISVSRDGTYMLSGSSDLLIYNIFSDMSTIPASKKVATIVELTGQVTIVGGGLVTVTASQELTTNYNAPTPISAKFLVNKVTPVLSNVTVSKTYGDVAFQVAAPAGSSTSGGAMRYAFSSGDTTVASITDSGLITVNKVGTVVFSAKQDETSGYNAPTPVTVTLTVGKATPTITISNISKSTADSTFTFATSTASDGALTFSSNTIGVATINSSSGLVTIVGIVGTTTITVSQAVSTNYNAPSNATAILTVTKGTPTLSAFSIAPKIFGISSFPVTAPSSQNTVGTFHYTSDTPGVATITDSGTITIVGAGSTTITANQDATTNFNAPTAITAILTVAKATPTIVVSNITKSSIDPTFTFARSTASDGALSFSSNSESVAKINSVSGVVTIIGIAGTATITVSQAASTNYNAPTNATATLTVTAGTLTNATVSAGADLSGKNLSGASLVGLTLTNVILSNSNLNGANFSGANVTGVDFTNASIVGATNLPTFSTKQKLQLLYNANNAGANVSQLQFSAPLSVSELNAALSVPIPELSSVKTEFLIAAPVYDASSVKTVTIATSSISTVNNTSLYIPLNVGETVKINGILYTLNVSNQLLDNNGVVLKLIVVNGYPFKVYTGSIIAVNISNLINNVTFDTASTVKLYDIVNSMVKSAVAQEAISGIVAGYVSELYTYLDLSYSSVYSKNNPTLDATVSQPAYSSYTSNTNTFSYNVIITGPAANPLSLDKTKYKFIVESVNNSTLSRTTVSQPTWDSIASPTTIACASLSPLTSYSVIVTPTLFNSTSNVNLKSLLPVKTLTFTTPLDYGLISSVTFTKESTLWYFNFQYSGYASLTSFTMGLTWVQNGGAYGGSITQNFSSFVIANGTNKYLITDTQNYLNVGGPSLIGNTVTATIDYTSGTAIKQNITTFIPNPLVGGPYVLGISNFNTDIIPGTCTATIPALLESQRGSRGWYYTVSFVETATGTESGMSAFYATGSAKSSFTVSFPLTLYGKTFTSKLYIRNDGQSWSGDYLPLQDLTPNTTSFTIPNPTGIFPTEVTLFDHKGMNWNVGGATDDVRLFKVTWRTTTTGLNVSSPNYVSKVRVNIKLSGESSYRFTGVYNYADGFGYSMFHSSIRTSQGQSIGTWVVDIRSENTAGTITSVYSSYSQYGGVTPYGNYYTLADLAAEAGISTILYSENVASTFAVSSLALLGGYIWNSSTLKYATSVSFKTSIPYGTSTTTYKHKVELVNPDTTKSTLGSFILDNSTQTLAASPLNPSSTYTIKVTLVDSVGTDVTGIMASSQTLTLTVPAAQ